MVPTKQPLPKHAAEDIAIAQLTDLYQQQLSELNACHSLLLADQERLATLLAPHITPSGQISPEALQQLDPMVLVFKEGLDLRLNEFQEDCRRIQATERRLQRKIEQAAADYEANFLATSGLADARILKRLREQQRLIQIQQQELDQARFEKELLEGENNRLKVLCMNAPDFSFTAPNQPAPWQDKPSLHIAAEARDRPQSNVLHAGGVQLGLPLATEQAQPNPAQPAEAKDSSWYQSFL